MKKILVAVDGSDHALKGVRVAAEMARPAGARLELAYVSPPNLLPPDVYAEMVARIEAEEKKFADQILSRAAAEAKAAGVESESIMLTGSPAEALNERADLIDASMIVVGSRGQGAVKRVLLGSVADRLVHVAHRSVLVVH